ncbi:AraC family transcriptional regulator [Flavicella sp.]|uniref:helix-turn-helix transcriptional regulator n=1 Tax=Flavicella sp. TaxID=2957742 RepID=UPI0030190385
MQIHFKGSIFKDGNWVRFFKKDLKNSVIKGTKFVVNNSHTQGLIQEIQLNGIFILAQNIKTNENLEIKCSNDFPLFKLHFEFNGDINCNFSSKKKSDLKVLKGMCNLFYLPKSKTTYTYNQTNKRSFEMFFTEDYLLRKMGPSFTSTLQNTKLNQKPFMFFKGGILMNDIISVIVNDILKCSYSSIMKKEFLEAKTTELIITALTNYDPKSHQPVLSQSDKEKLKKVVNHIKMNLKTPLTIPKLSLLAGINTSKLKKCFKQFYGTTIFKYITSSRIEKAKELIQKENYTISQASYKVGYKNPQHFTVAFKKKLGYLPSKLKNNLS